jgi:hypothetical protein
MNEKDQNTKGGSGQSVTDFTPFCENDIEPTLNKKIVTLIDAEEDYIVYIDDQYFVQWSFTATKEIPEGFGKVTNSLRYLETISRTQLQKSQFKEFACLLAEGMARIVSGEGERIAIESLDKAEAYLRDRGGENARMWYIIGSSASTIPIILLVFLFVIFRSDINQYFNNVNIYEVILGALIGGFGALFFILTRSGKIPVDPAAGKFIHILESASRILTGVLGALLMALAIKSNILLGIIKDKIDHPFIVLLVICFCAGASERLVPGFIKKVKNSTSVNK